MTGAPTIACVVVTHNRRILLERCLLAITAQTNKPHLLIVIDNASDDGTSDWATDWLLKHATHAECIVLTENVGGAGGFSEGLRISIEYGADWIWMMDDDAEAHPDALEKLLEIADNPANVYGSIAINGTNTAWATTLLGPPKRCVDTVADIPRCARVESLPFLGFMIHRDLVGRIGLPDAEFFIAADDVEYCLRAVRSGAEIIVSGLSRIEHPKADRNFLHIFGRKIAYLRLPAWKRYYDTRNRLLIARKYYGVRLFSETIPGSLVRMFTAMLHEPAKLSQLLAFSAGMFDGLLGRKGKRHGKWGIRQ